MHQQRNKDDRGVSRHLHWWLAIFAGQQCRLHGPSDTVGYMNKYLGAGKRKRSSLEWDRREQAQHLVDEAAC